MVCAGVRIFVCASDIKYTKTNIQTHTILDTHTY